MNFSVPKPRVHLPKLGVRRVGIRLLHAPRPAKRIRSIISATSAPPSGAYREQGDKIGEYVIDRFLGRGGSSVTYLASRADGQGKPVALKCLSLRSLQGWKALDLFEREAKTLRALDHSGIPRYVDSFEIESASDKEFIIVQENVDGRTLAEVIRDGWRPTEAQVISIALQLLDILTYLGSLRPPVIHRDIGPNNIVLGGGTGDGKVFLIDFGGVQEASAGSDFLGSTVIGTYGFGAPEQFRGAALAASDAYGVGATLLYLISGGRSPLSFPQKKLRVDFSEVVVSDRLRAAIEGLLEPAPEDRMEPATARDVLTGRQAVARPGQTRAREERPQPAWVFEDPTPSTSSEDQTAVMGGRTFRVRPPSNVDPGSLVQRNKAVKYVDDGDRIPGWAGKIVPTRNLTRPAGARAIITKVDGILSVSIPSRGFGGDTLFLGAFATAWNSFLVFWVVSALTAGGGLVAFLFSLPFWLAGGTVVQQLLGAFVRTELTIGEATFRLDKKLALINKDGSADWRDENTKKTLGAREDLVGSYVDVKGSSNGVPISVLVLDTGAGKDKQLELGEGLSLEENEWLSSEINMFLGIIRNVNI